MARDTFELSELDDFEIDDDVLASGDPDAIAAAFENSGEEVSQKETDITDDANVEKEVDDDVTKDVETETSKDDSKKSDSEKTDLDLVHQKAEEAEVDTVQDDMAKSKPTKKFVMGKDNVSKIPFGVLEGTRQELNEARNTIKQLESKHQQELAKAIRANEVLRGQLQRADLSPEDIPDNLDITDEMLAAIDKLDDSGALSKVVRQMKWQNDELRSMVSQNQSQPTSQNATNNDVQNAINANPKLKEWLDNGDSDRVTLANKIDRELQNSPEFRDKPLADLFAEVVLRVEQEFGDLEQTVETVDDKDVKKLAQDRIDAASKTSQVPNSLTDIGRPTGSEKTISEQVDDMSESQLAAKFENMTNDQMEKFLAELG